MLKYKVRREHMDFGEFTAEELVLRLNMGLLKGDEMVRTEQMTQWIPLTEAMREHARSQRG